MVGRADNDTPPSLPPTRNTSPGPGAANANANVNPETRSWWKRWVYNESMNRVVFAAFQMDTLHASMFGHSADLLPHELRLQLPCDDSLWTATSAEEVRRLEGTFAMYRIKTVNFLDGLKRCLHGYEVQTHHYARMVLMSGLLSVGWHINRREKHVQFVETMPSVQEQARWRSLLLQAFGHWRRSFDEVLDYNTYKGQGATRSTKRDMSDPTVLFHLAHLTMHADIIDCQILSGSRHLMGRKVSDRDRASAIQRMRAWANTSMARHASLHAFKLLESTFCAKKFRQTVPSPQNGWSSVAESTYRYVCYWCKKVLILTRYLHQLSKRSVRVSPMDLMPCRLDDLGISVCLLSACDASTESIHACFDPCQRLPVHRYVCCD